MPQPYSAPREIPMLTPEEKTWVESDAYHQCCADKQLRKEPRYTFERTLAFVRSNGFDPEKIGVVQQY